MSRRAKRKPPKTKHFTSKMQASLLLVFCVILAAFILVIISTTRVSVKNNESYKRRVLSQQSYVSSEIPYRRGDITDRNGMVMATSIRVYKLVLDPVQLLEEPEYKEPTLQLVTRFFNLTREEIEAVLAEKSTSQYVILQKEVSYEEKQAYEEGVEAYVAQAKEEEKDWIQGIWFEEYYKRTYPLNEIACDVLGFTYSENAGNWGIEERYNDTLNGVNGRSYGYYDSELKLQRTVKDAEDGSTIVSTIDATVQEIVQEKMEAFVQETGCENIACVMMDPNSGEVLAMASYPFYDLNNPRDLTPFYTAEELGAMSEEEQLNARNELWRNFCVSDGYEPGSTFKPFVVSAGLDAGILTGKETYQCPGYYEVAGTKIRCAKRTGHGSLTLGETIKYSCNVGLMQVAQKIGRTYFRHYEDVFGFGQKTGIDLPGESGGILFSEEQLNATELATSSFGQGISVTMIQMVSAYSSLVNGGNYYQPHIVKRILNASGSTLKEVEPILVKRTISQNVSDKILSYMKDAVESGTATGAQVEGYEVAGKTGTAEKYPRNNKKYLVSFLGCVPVDHPQVVIYVIIDEPHVANQAQSGLATRLASSIMTDTLPFLNVYSNKEPEKTEQSSKDKENTSNLTGDFVDNGVADQNITNPPAEIDDPTTEYEP